MTDGEEVTALLQDINDSAASAPEKLLPLVYDELRRLAQSYMKNETPDHAAGDGSCA